MSGLLHRGSTATGDDILAPTMVYRTIMDAVRKKLVFRPLAAMIISPAECPGSSVKVSLRTPESMTVQTVAEGAEFPIGQETYDAVTFTPVKYGVNIGITREMIEDGQFSAVQMNAETAAYELADNEDALVVTALASASSTASHDVANSNATIAISDITEAMQNLENDGYNPTHLIAGVEVVNDLRNIDSFHEADKSGGVSPQDNLIGTIYGMKVLVSRNVSSVVAFVIDRNHAFGICDKRPVSIEGYDDWLRDTHHIIASQRVDVQALRSNAVSEITTT